MDTKERRSDYLLFAGMVERIDERTQSMTACVERIETRLSLLESDVRDNSTTISKIIGGIILIGFLMTGAIGVQFIK